MSLFPLLVSNNYCSWFSLIVSSNKQEHSSNFLLLLVWHTPPSTTHLAWQSHPYTLHLPTVKYIRLITHSNCLWRIILSFKVNTRFMLSEEAYSIHFTRPNNPTTCSMKEATVLYWSTRKQQGDIGKLAKSKSGNNHIEWHHVSTLVFISLYVLFLLLLSMC